MASSQARLRRRPGQRAGSVDLFQLKKCAYLNRIPLLAARLDLPCVRDQRLRRWIAAPLAMNKVDSFDYILLGDTVIERPHAHMERISKNARRAKFPWLASRFRIKENLEVANTLAGPARGDVQQLWFRYKDASLGKPGKMKRSAFEHTLYTLRHPADGEPAPRGRAGAACGGAGAPHGGPLGGEYFDDGADDGAGGGGPGTEAPSLKETIAGKIMKKWLLSVLKPFTSVTVRDADAPLGQRAMQILSLQRTSSVGKSWETWSSPDHRLTVHVEPFVVWDGGIPEPPELEVYAMENPRKVDLMALDGDRGGPFAPSLLGHKRTTGLQSRNPRSAISDAWMGRDGREESMGAAREGQSEGVRLPCFDAVAVFLSGAAAGGCVDGVRCPTI